MIKNLIITILTIISVLSFIFAFVQRGEALKQEAQSHECNAKLNELQRDLIQCKSEAEKQQQRMIQAERMAIEMTNELRLKELAKKK